ncbi:hypothetical protein HDU98_007612 [Podochytrium sp. JEL0797]|nr:hypothetical protein HDU98_007612 [Podochytrium sp. JEL0797]
MSAHELELRRIGSRHSLSQALESHRGPPTVPELPSMTASPTQTTAPPLTHSVAIGEAGEQHSEEGLVVATLLGTFPIRYSNPENKFFSEIRPLELEGLISSHDFHTQMKQLNEELGTVRFKDYTPVLRTLLMVGFFAGGITIFEKDYMKSMFYWTFGLALVFILMMASYYRSGPAHKTTLLSTGVLGRGLINGNFPSLPGDDDTLACV